jgi:hypothetical protein
MNISEMAVILHLSRRLAHEPVLSAIAIQVWLYCFGMLQLARIGTESKGPALCPVNGSRFLSARWR